jgi:hypothetical protein
MRAFRAGFAAVMAAAMISSSLGAEEENRLVFGNEQDIMNSKQAVETRRKLSDPAEREALRAQHVEQIKRQHPDLIEVLNITPKQYDEFIEIWADWQMEHLDLFWAKDPANADRQVRFERMSKLRAELDSKLAALLGTEKYDQYQSYKHTIMARKRIADLNQRLPANQAVTGDRKFRFINLLMEEQDAFTHTRVSRHVLGDRLPGTLEDWNDPKKRERFNQEMTVKGNEEALEAMEASSASLKERAAEILTPAQLAQFVQMEDQRVARQRKWVEGLRRDFESSK